VVDTIIFNGGGQGLQAKIVFQPTAACGRPPPRLKPGR
jgi:hypothetical protein